MPLASKTSVAYSPGMEKSHCGPTHKWADGTNPKKFCKHFFTKRMPFEVPACHKVSGAIDRTYWCRKFEAKHD